MACLDIDRSANRVFTLQLLYGRAESLRTKGPKIFLVPTFDLNVPPGKRAFFRCLTEGERFVVQGHAASYVRDFKTIVSARAATGNAYAIPMLAAAVVPLVHCSVASAVCSPKGMQTASRAELVSLFHADMPTTKRRRTSKGPP